MESEINIDELEEKEVLKLILREVSSLKKTQSDLATEVATLKADSTQASVASVSDNRGVGQHEVPLTVPAVATTATAQPRSAEGTPTPRGTVVAQNSGDGSPTVPTLGTGAAADVESKYWALSDTLKHIRLEADYVLKDNHKGFKKDFQPAAKVVSRSARYVETGLKLLSCCQPSPEVQDLVLIHQAHLEFLKCEYSCLVVANDNNKDVSQNYRRLKAGTIGLSQGDLQDLKLAQEIVAHSQAAPQERDRRDNQRGGRYQQYGRGRGFNQRGRDSRYRQFVSNDQLPHAPTSQATSTE